MSKGTPGFNLGPNSTFIPVKYPFSDDTQINRKKYKKVTKIITLAAFLKTLLWALSIKKVLLNLELIRGMWKFNNSMGNQFCCALSYIKYELTYRIFFFWWFEVKSA